MEYRHEEAVADKVNVPFDVYRIRTEITERSEGVISRTSGKCFAAIDRRSKLDLNPWSLFGFPSSKLSACLARYSRHDKNRNVGRENIRHRFAATPFDFGQRR